MLFFNNFIVNFDNQAKSESASVTAVSENKYLCIRISAKSCIGATLFLTMLEAVKNKLYLRIFVRKYLAASPVMEKSPIFSTETKFYQSVCKLYQWIEGLKCMEPLEQNLALFSLSSYIATTLVKIIEKTRVLYKVDGGMFEKARKK